MSIITCVQVGPVTHTTTCDGVAPSHLFVFDYLFRLDVSTRQSPDFGSVLSHQPGFETLLARS